MASCFQDFSFVSRTAINNATGVDHYLGIVAPTPAPFPPATDNGRIDIVYRGDYDSSSERIDVSVEGSPIGVTSRAPGFCPSSSSSNTFPVPTPNLNTWASDGEIGVFAANRPSVNRCPTPTPPGFVRATARYRQTVEALCGDTALAVDQSDCMVDTNALGIDFGSTGDIINLNPAGTFSIAFGSTFSPVSFQVTGVCNTFTCSGSIFAGERFFVETDLKTWNSSGERIPFPFRGPFPDVATNSPITITVSAQGDLNDSNEDVEVFLDNNFLGEVGDLGFCSATLQQRSLVFRPGDSDYLPLVGAFNGANSPGSILPFFADLESGVSGSLCGSGGRNIKLSIEYVTPENVLARCRDPPPFIRNPDSCSIPPPQSIDDGSIGRIVGQRPTQGMIMVGNNPFEMQVRSICGSDARRQCRANYRVGSNFQSRTEIYTVVDTSATQSTVLPIRVPEAASSVQITLVGRGDFDDLTEEVVVRVGGTVILVGSVSPGFQFDAANDCPEDFVNMGTAAVSASTFNNWRTGSGVVPFQLLLGQFIDTHCDRNELFVRVEFVTFSLPRSFCRSMARRVIPGTCFADVSIDDGSYRFAGNQFSISQSQTRFFIRPFQGTISDYPGVALTTRLCNKFDRCFANVRVINDAPIAICENIRIPATTCCGATIRAGDVYLMARRSRDPNGHRLTFSSPREGQLLPLGEHTVPVRVRDQCGAVSVCTARVTVFDDEPLDSRYLRCGHPGILDECDLPLTVIPTYKIPGKLPNSKLNGCNVTVDIFPDFQCRFCDEGVVEDRLTGGKGACKVERRKAGPQLSGVRRPARLVIEDAEPGDFITYGISVTDDKSKRGPKQTTLKNKCTLCVDGGGGKGNCKNGKSKTPKDDSTRKLLDQKSGSVKGVKGVRRGHGNRELSKKKDDFKCPRPFKSGKDQFKCKS